MENVYSHIHPDYQHLIALDKEQKIQSLHEDIWINYPQSDKIIQLLNNMMNRPKKPRMQGLLLIGDSNMGKTSIIHRFRSLHQDTMMDDDNNASHVYKPVVYALMRGCDEKELYASILESFWAPYRPSDTQSKLRHQLIGLMRSCQVRIVLLDELHNLLRGTAAKQRIIMDAIKNLSVELMIPIVGIGTKDAALVLATDPQHSSRFDIIKLPKWELNKNFRALLVAFEKRLPLQKPSLLDTKEKATLLYSISRGNLGDLHRLLIECATYAIEHEIEEITIDIIKRFSWVKPTDTYSAREIILDSY